MEVDNQAAAASNLDLSNQRGAGTQAQGSAAVRSGNAELLFDEDRLKIYYECIFPYQLMFKWISYGKMVQRD